MPLPFFLVGLLALTGAAAGAYRRLQRNAASCEHCGSTLTAANEASCAACGSEICTRCVREPPTGSALPAAMRPASPVRYPLCPGCAHDRFPFTAPEARIEPPSGVGRALTDAAVGLPSTTEGTSASVDAQVKAFTLPSHTKDSNPRSNGG